MINPESCEAINCSEVIKLWPNEPQCGATRKIVKCQSGDDFTVSTPLRMLVECPKKIVESEQIK